MPAMMTSLRVHGKRAVDPGDSAFAVADLRVGQRRAVDEGGIAGVLLGGAFGAGRPFGRPVAGFLVASERAAGGGGRTGET